jgi:hypothetical protein
VITSSHFSRRVISPATKAIEPDSGLPREMTLLARLVSRPLITTRAPAPAKASAVASPMPEVPPVISTRLPLKSKRSEALLTAVNSSPSR